MFHRDRNTGVTFGYVVAVIFVAAVAAGCVSTIDPAWVTELSSLVQAAATTPPESDIPIPETSTERTADASAVVEPVAEAAPSPITHRLAGRETCLDCHEAESGRDPAPADHRHLAETVCLYCHMPEEGEAAVPPLPAKAEVDFCLGCHGPFEELAARTEGSILVENVAANPHMYVPHDSTRIFACASCHAVHPLPVGPADEFAQANVQYCFMACHHSDDFRPCQACHDEE